MIWSLLAAICGHSRGLSTGGAQRPSRSGTQAKNGGGASRRTPIPAVLKVTPPSRDEPCQRTRFGRLRRPRRLGYSRQPLPRGNFNPAPFLDHNASTPLHPAARAALLEAADRFWAHPLEPVWGATAARDLLADCRERPADLLGCTDPGRIVLTAGAAANNLVARHFSTSFPPDAIVPGRNVVTRSAASPSDRRATWRPVDL